MLTRAVERVATHAKRIVQVELELAALELKRKVAALGAGIALVATAAVLGLFGLGFGLATVAAALATFLPTWLALLIVTAGVFALAGGLAGVGVMALRKATPPVPELALQEAKLTAEALKDGGG